MVYDPRQDPKYKNDRLFLSLLNKESRFNPNAVSPTGARGYAQILRSTASDPGFGIAPNPAAIHDPEQNVAFGKSYLDAMKKRYKGDTAAALVAYNGGPVAADRWVASGKNDKVISPESRDYYKTILKNAGEGYNFSKVKVSLPKDVSTNEDDESETANTTGFSKLKVPGSKPVVAKPSEDESDAEEADDEEKVATPKVAKVKASKKEDDEDDDEEDDDEGSSSSKSKGGRSIAGGALELKQFTPGPMFKPVAVQLGVPKLQIAALETLDDPRDR